MTIRLDIPDHWPQVRAHLPADFDLERTARARGAFTRAREVKNAEGLLRLALAYGGCGMSLRETCAWAEAAGLASLANPSLEPQQSFAAVKVDEVALVSTGATPYPGERDGEMRCLAGASDGRDRSSTNRAEGP